MESRVFFSLKAMALFGVTAPAHASQDPGPSDSSEVLKLVSEALSSGGETEDIELGVPDENGVVIPENAGEDIVLPSRDEEIKLTLPAEKSGEYSLLETGDAIVDAQDDHAQLLVQDYTPNELQGQMDGIRVIASLNTPEADPLLRFGLRIPQGAQILFYDDGTGEVSNSDGTFIGAIGTAWAVDAEGKEVPTWYEYENGELYQYVDHLSGDFAYPIIADPAFVVPLIIHGGRIIFQRVIAPALISAGRIAVQQLAKKGIKAVVTGLRSFTRTNARHNLIVSSRRNPGGRCEAHHTLPVKFSPRFEKAGFRGSDSIHHPKYLVWWEKMITGRRLRQSIDRGKAGLTDIQIRQKGLCLTSALRSYASTRRGAESHMIRNE